MKRTIPALTVILMLLTLVKLTYLQMELGLLRYPATFLAASLIVIASIYLPLVLIRGARQPRASLVVHTVLSILVFADLVHARFFHTVIPVQALFLLGEATGVPESIKSLLRPTDVLLFADSIVLLVLLRSSKGKDLPNCRLTSSVLFLVLLLCLLGTGVTTTTQAMGRPQVLAQLGALPYHVYDACSSLRKATVEYDYDALVLQKEQAWMSKRLEHHGLARGRNVIVIQVEALQDFLVHREVNGQEITPVLNRLIQKDSFYFNSYFQSTSLGSTSDAEFSSHNSLYPSLERASYQQYEGKNFYTLPLALKDAGYSTAAFHGFRKDFWNRDRFYPGQGFDVFYSDELFTLDEKIGMGLSDGSFLRQALSYLQEMKQPFYAFMVTLSGHHPWIVPGKYRDLELPDNLPGTTLGNYLQCTHYVDQAIGEFLQQLKTTGLYENSTVVIYGDHFGMRVDDANMNKQMSELLGYKYDYDEMLNVPLIIHVPGMGRSETVDTTGSQIDLFPTMLNLLGLEKDRTAVLAGQDLLNTDEGFAALKILSLEKGSFVDNDIMFEMSRDGVFEHSRAWNLQNHEPVLIDSYREKSRRAALEWDFSAWMLDNDLVRSAKLVR